ERFEVSLRTIYRDIKSLTNAGVPIYGDPGSGYSLVKDYRIPPVLFTREEALSFVAAEKLMFQYLDKQLAINFSSALSKMKSVLRTSEKEILAVADKSVILKGNYNNFNESVPEALSILLTSISAKQIINIKYRKKDSEANEERRLEPVGLFRQDSFWYFMAYCHLRNDYRQFRLDRIDEIRLTNENFTRIHKDLKHFLNQKKKHPTIKVIIQVEKSLSHYLQWERDYYGFISEKELENVVEMEFACRNEGTYFLRWFASFGDHATIIEPKELKANFHSFLKEQLEHLTKQ
ncbi:MAG: transcriptional regulator, partial [Pseudopedobacter saltans]